MAKLRSNLTSIAARVPINQARIALAETAADIVALTKDLTPVDTGRLRGSYRAELQGPDKVVIGTDVPYGPHVEFGTSRSPAQPHFTPAFAQAEATFRARLTQKLKS
jgi:HK97 gp10 family phage protein